jgi:hypothetical protein
MAANCSYEGLRLSEGTVNKNVVQARVVWLSILMLTASSLRALSKLLRAAQYFKISTASLVKPQAAKGKRGHYSAFPIANLNAVLVDRAREGVVFYQLSRIVQGPGPRAFQVRELSTEPVLEQRSVMADVKIVQGHWALVVSYAPQVACIRSELNE